MVEHSPPFSPELATLGGRSDAATVEGATLLDLEADFLGVEKKYILPLCSIAPKI